MKDFLMITTASVLLCSQALAQQATVMPTPSLSVTSPLGMVPSAPVGGTGIPFGATEITSPGVSPMPLPSTGLIGSAVCSTIGTAPSTMFGSAASFDGGGMSVGTVTPQSAMTSALIDTSGTQSMCGAGANNLGASSAPTAPTTPGGVPRAGIPMGSTEIGNLGVSSAVAVPIITVTPTIASTFSTAPATTLSAPNTALPAATNPITGMPSISGIQSIVPALSPGATTLP